MNIGVWSQGPGPIHGSQIARRSWVDAHGFTAGIAAESYDDGAWAIYRPGSVMVLVGSLRDGTYGRDIAEGRNLADIALAATLNVPLDALCPPPSLPAHTPFLARWSMGHFTPPPTRHWWAFDFLVQLYEERARAGLDCSLATSCRVAAHLLADL